MTVAVLTVAVQCSRLDDYHKYSTTIPSTYSFKIFEKS